MKSVLLLACIVLGCSSGTAEYYPKPKGFSRIDLPEISYEALEGDYPYSFMKSKHAVVQIDSFANAEPYWIILYYPAFNGRIQLTYKNFAKNSNALSAHIEDSYKLAAKHQVRASSISDTKVQLKNGRTATLIEIEGEVPSHFQFFATDTSQHFLRGATYLEDVSKNDSLRPVIDYLKADAMHMLQTLSWKK